MEHVTTRRVRVNIKQLASLKYQAETTAEVSTTDSLVTLDHDLEVCLLLADENARWEVSRREARDAGSISDAEAFARLRELLDKAAQEAGVAVEVKAPPLSPLLGDAPGSVSADVLTLSTSSGGAPVDGPVTQLNADDLSVASVPNEEGLDGLPDDIPF